MRLGLVLGGGGVVGIAWETGVLAGLADATGWDPASAATIVGTSAGSVVGTQVRHGRPLDELVAAQRDGASSGHVRAEGPADPEAAMAVFRAWAAAEVMEPPVARRVAELACLAAGLPEEAWVANFAEALPDGGWPPGDLRVTGVSVAGGQRVVWTASSAVPLVRAVAASCAVPGLFPPVTVDGDRYVDGGLWSGSNADVLAGEALDALLFVGPMTAAGGGIGSLSARMLGQERAALAAAGSELHVLEPGERFRAAQLQLMDASRRADAVSVGLAEGAEAAAQLRGLLG